MERKDNRYLIFGALAKICERKNVSVKAVFTNNGKKQATTYDRYSKPEYCFEHRLSRKVINQICQYLKIDEDEFCSDEPIELNPLVETDRHIFETRLRSLVERCEIPPYLNGEPTDVGTYAWQMKDDILDGCSLTFSQQHLCYLQLSSGPQPCLRIASDPPELEHTKGRVGRVEVLLPTHDDLAKAFNTRLALGRSAYRELVVTGSKSPKWDWVHTVRDAFEERFLEYNEIAARLTPDEDPASDLHNHILQADYDCRRAFYEPLSIGGNTFAHVYGRIRVFVNMWRMRYPQNFSLHWFDMIASNTANLALVDGALNEKPVNAKLLGQCLHACAAQTLLRSKEVEELESATESKLEADRDRKAEESSPTAP